MKSVEEPWQLVSIDPGILSTGIALWHGNRLHAVDYIDNTPRLAYDIDALIQGTPSRNVVVEGQYVGMASIASVVELSYWAGAAAHACLGENIEKVKPSTWKGGAPKNKMCAVFYSRLNPEEKKRLDVAVRCFTKVPMDKLVTDMKNNIKKVYKKNTAHGKLSDVLDAVGLGLWYLKRFKPS